MKCNVEKKFNINIKNVNFKKEIKFIALKRASLERFLDLCQDRLTYKKNLIKKHRNARKCTYINTL